jgi:RNA polymerase sigma factor (sigma-70 family)
MEPLPRLKKHWVLTQDSFDRLLTRLDADRERAGEKYEHLRRVLIRFFQWRGCAFPEDEADETLNRVAGKLAEGEDIRDLHGYSFGVARRLLLEALQKQRAEKRAEVTEELPGLPGCEPESSEAELRLRCCERCLDRLSPEKRKLIMQYYEAEQGARIDHRVELAGQMDLSLSNLRLRVFRIRAQLNACVSRCLRQARKKV